ncbi:MAG: C10 family peptidase, partial [Rickettsiales bacterium]|nr:C10 family peptidase [Rickettsiales bacterium]
MPAARANRVDAAAADNVANRHLQKRHRMQRRPNVRLKYSARKTNRRGTRSGAAPDPDAPAYYVFDENESKKGGFVIVSGDDIAKPILGWSENGNYDEKNLSPEFQYWMEFLQDQIERAQAQGATQSDSVKRNWADALGANGGVMSASGGAGYLVQTEWSQSAPYYNMTPMHNGYHSVTGCVATAMAQIMNYHRHPGRGSGSTSAYSTRTYGISVPSVALNVDYDWDYMSDTYPVSGADAARKNDAVATLMYHVGAAVQMDYSSGESGAYSYDVPGALRNYFGYGTMDAVNMTTFVTQVISNGFNLNVHKNYKPRSFTVPDNIPIFAGMTLSISDSD